ncbi:MAG: hypothetical protein IJW73_06695 [Candidatus Gastranaerophilales bacterium]|nr:hypothetical protein [Candidatus Gastranaerophilales bacterium]
MDNKIHFSSIANLNKTEPLMIPNEHESCAFLGNENIFDDILGDNQINTDAQSYDTGLVELVDFFHGEYDDKTQDIDNYYKTEGLVDDLYNILKGALNFGLTHKDIQAYYENENHQISLLSSSLLHGNIKIDDGNSQLSDNELINEGKISKEAFSSIVQDRIANAQSINEVILYCENFLNLPKDTTIGLLEQYLTQKENERFADTSGAPLENIAKNEPLEIKILENADGSFSIASDNPRSYAFRYPLELKQYMDLITGATVNTDQGSFVEFSDSIIDKIDTGKEYEFKELYMLLTGVEYNPELIEQANDAYAQSADFSIGLAEALTQEDKLANIKTVDDMAKFVGGSNKPLSKETIDKINSFYDEYLKLANSNGGINDMSSLKLSDDASSVTISYKVPPEKLAEFNKSLENTYLDSGQSYNYNKEQQVFEITYPLHTVDLMIARANKEIVENSALSSKIRSDFEKTEFAQNFNSLEEFIEASNATIAKAYGNNILDKKFTEYCYDMDTYSTKAAKALYNAGRILQLKPLMILSGVCAEFIDLVNAGTNKIEGDAGDAGVAFAKTALIESIGLAKDGIYSKHFETTINSVKHGKFYAGIGDYYFDASVDKIIVGEVGETTLEDSTLPKSVKDEMSDFFVKVYNKKDVFLVVGTNFICLLIL